MTDAMTAILEDEVRAAGVWERYQELRANGTGIKFAAMLAMQRAPCTKGTANHFFEGRMVSEYDSPVGKMQLAMAHKAGINTHGKIYVTGLADADKGPGTPEAWVSDPSDIVKVAAMKGRSVAGCVNYTAPEREPEPDIPLGDDIVRECIADETRADPKFAELHPVEQREAVIEKFGPSV